MRELVISKELSGGRLDKMIFKYLDRAPKSFVYKMLRKKNIELNGKKASGSELLKEGDSIRFFLSEETLLKFHNPEESGLSAAGKNRNSLVSEKLFSLIVYEDENLIALNKPSGLLSQKAKPEDISLNELLTDYLGSRKPEGSPEILFTPGISNRLDRNTSGLVLAGKNPAAARELNNAIRQRRLKKYYLCLVKGRIRKSREIQGFLVKDEKTNRVRILPSPSEGGAARIFTAYEPLCHTEEATLLKVDLITGKSHQIRAHLASTGHPIIGDVKYGGGEDGIRRQLLHAFQIRFTEMEGVLQYLTGSEITAPLPEDFKNEMQKRGFNAGT